MRWIALPGSCAVGTSGTLPIRNKRSGALFGDLSTRTASGEPITSLYRCIAIGTD